MNKYELRVASGNQLGTLIPVPMGRFIIGREQDCHLRPNSELISRHHCAFTVDDQGIRVRDLGSTNGTFVNGQRAQGSVQLAAGDRVSAGKVDLVVVVDGVPTVDAGDTMQASHGDTMMLTRGSGTAAAPSEGNTAIDIFSMSDALSALEDETVAAAAAASAPAPVAPAAEAAPVPTSGYDTQEISTAVATDLLAAPNPQVAYNPWGGMPQYPYPQFPPMPQMPYGYGYPYPPQGMPPGYPQMPPGYGYPPPPQPVEVEQPAAATKVSNMPETRLPDPSETGAKAPEPRPAAPAGGGDKSKAHIPTAAQDIINSYLNRRPKSS